MRKHKTKHLKTLKTIIGAALLISGSASGMTIEHISNGGFETGTLAGWTISIAGPGPATTVINDGTINPTGPSNTTAPISETTTR